MLQLETRLAPPLPWYARLAHLILAAMMALILAVLAMSSATDRFSWTRHGIGLLLAIALAGHVRRVAWGRGMGSLFSVWVAIMVTAALLPDSDSPAVLDEALPLWLDWLLIVGAALLALLPATVVGLRREWFSDAWW